MEYTVDERQFTDAELTLIEVWLVSAEPEYGTHAIGKNAPSTTWVHIDREGHVTKPIWMVAGIPYESGSETPTFGPFATREEADAFAASYPGRYVYDDRLNRESLCGPWLP